MGTRGGTAVSRANRGLRPLRPLRPPRRGCVQARKTRSRGALKMRVRVNSRSAVLGVVGACVIADPLLDPTQMVAKAVEAAVPELPVVL